MNTPWTENVDLNMPLPEYPRPQMARRLWMNLNGPWEYAISTSSRCPESFDGRIIVPFSPETEISGVGRTLNKGEYLWYRRELSIPAEFSGKHLLLHFGAVDQEAIVWVNGRQVAKHSGGYLPFEADITQTVEDGAATITLRVEDNTDYTHASRGKQKSNRGGIWYTQQSGIWQTVWIEAVPDCYISSLTITPDFDNSCVEISADVIGDELAYASFQGQEYHLPAIIPVPDFEPWSPENPKLYSFTVHCGEDEVYSYFAMRKLSVDKDSDGVVRLFLNNEPYFQNGLLDQGYWPDGMYTAVSDEAMIFDISTAKAMGFNMLRKHIKVEPLRWYYHCDRYGMLVWQDMPNGGGKYNPLIITSPLFTDIHISDRHYALFARSDSAARAQYKSELTAMVKLLYNSPCICMWVLFNEGWGQFDSAKMHELVQKIDKTRFIDHASGWHDQGIGSIKSIHVYFKRFRFKPDRKGRAVVLSEFGGYSHQVLGHCFNNKYFGYKKYEMPIQLQHAIEDLFQDQICKAKQKGLSAAVYTQLSDVEDELNGLITYDRKIVKIAPEIVQTIINVD